MSIWSTLGSALAASDFRDGEGKYNDNPTSDVEVFVARSGFVDLIRLSLDDLEVSNKPTFDHDVYMTKSEAEQLLVGLKACIDATP